MRFILPVNGCRYISTHLIPSVEGTHAQPRMFKLRKTIGLVAAAICCHTLSRGVVAVAAEHSDWATGAALSERLAQPVDILWSGSQLRSAIESLSQAQRVGILIDRRVDPGQKLDVAIKAQPLAQRLRR